MSSHSDSEDSISGESSTSDKDDVTDTTGSSGRRSSSDDNKVKFVEKESRYVYILRLCVLLVLILAAAVSVCVFFIASQGEQQSYEHDYDAAARKVTETFLNIATYDMGAAGSMVVAIVANGLALGRSWPFVTITSFQERAAMVKQLSNALYIGINPVVVDELREEWEVYSTSSKDAEWYQDGVAYQTYLGIEGLDNREQVTTENPNLNLCCGVANHIYDFHRNSEAKADISPKAAWYLPIWQTSPVTRRTMVNQNRASNSNSSTNCLENRKVVFEGMQYSTPGYGDDPNPRTSEIAWLLRMANGHKTEYMGDIFSTVYLPLYDNFTGNRTTVGIMRIVIHWARYFRKLLPESTQGIVFVLDNNCDQPFTYRIDGGEVIPLGHGDLHDTKYNDMLKTASFAEIMSIADGTKEGLNLHQDECPYTIRVYPSETYYNTYHTSIPLVITCAVAIVFLYTVIVFYVYDRQVEYRQRLLLNKATQSHKIVASLFPKNVRDRLLEEGMDPKKSGAFLAPNQRLKTFLDGNENNNGSGQAPIADVFPYATVLFADIAGFTAWSSSREPAQVFILLQTLYQAFDQIAKRRRVFKVETIGDSYVAVTGVPEPQAGHPVIMARFAAEAVLKMQEVVRELEITLGPGTGELAMRIGMNSGPVTAGVLRGERSRFQLFGDTINTASRMESTGIPGKIQASQSTADLLIAAGKGHWVRSREDNVLAKGKGVLQTYWITPHSKKGTSNASSETGSTEPMTDTQEATTLMNTAELMKHKRQIDWVVELLQDSIRLIVAQRQAIKKVRGSIKVPEKTDNQIALDEVVEAIKLPDFDATAATASSCSVKISDEITILLREYVSIIASAYRDNPFHNFEHACHVTMSVSKFLKRIVTPEMELRQLDDLKDESTFAKKIASHLYDYTHGINSDPITLFAIVFSALIHDVDHRGVSNVQLMKEEPHMAQLFRNKSIAEQNSLAIAWDLLMSDRFNELRNYIFHDQEELKRFRQVIVNVVLATDIFDKELNELRKARWAKAFSENSILSNDKNSLRATIVMEHIMQASDVCHTMQHWHIYRKWNEKLFHEMLCAYRANKMAANPAEFWYTGELGFFDNYIIPLANKLKDCHVFGVSSDECLNYALRNRVEWEARGQEITEEMIQKFSVAGIDPSI